MRRTKGGKTNDGLKEEGNRSTLLNMNVCDNSDFEELELDENKTIAIE
jgi:hypothetical protein